MTFSQKLRELRKGRGFTQSTLAKATGISQSSIAAYELDEKNPTFLNVQKIARALGVSCLQLIDDEENGDPEPKRKKK